jgi:hypothetical protein
LYSFAILKNICCSIKRRRRNTCQSWHQQLFCRPNKRHRILNHVQTRCCLVILKNNEEFPLIATLFLRIMRQHLVWTWFKILCRLLSRQRSCLCQLQKVLRRRRLIEQQFPDSQLGYSPSHEVNFVPATISSSIFEN